MALLVVAVAVAGWIAASLAAARWVGSRARRVERSQADVPDKVHRLQRLMLSSFFAVLLAYLVAGVVSGAVAGAHHRHHGSRSAAETAQLVVAVVLIVGALVATIVLVPRPARVALARVRDVPVRLPDRRRRVVAGLVMSLGYAAVLVGGRLLVPRQGAGHAIGIGLVYGLAALVLAAVIVPLTVIRLRTKPMPGELRNRMRRLADDVGVHVRDFRVLQTSAQKIANAAQIGTIPGLRYIVVTDYMIEHFEPEELDAVVAHELAHARRHHLLIKLGVVLGVWAVLEGLAIAIGRSVGHGAAAFVAVPILLAIPIGMFVAQGFVGIRLEQSADDLAARQVGPEPLADALEQLAELNDTKRRTGRGWALLTQHPGLQTRLDRLHATPRAGT